MQPKPISTLPQRMGFRFIAVMQDGTRKPARMMWCAGRGVFVPTQSQLVGWLPNAPHF